MDNYLKCLKIDATPQTVYAALTSRIAGWWTTAADDASSVGPEFVTRFGATFNRIRVLSLDPNREVCWLVTEHHNASQYLTKHDEWTGTRMVWKIEPSDDGGTTLHFVHHGLVPTLECWKICAAAWDRILMHSLKPYAETGQGQPFQHQ